MRMGKGSLLDLYRPTYVRTLVYMMQSTEYQADTYLHWYWRTGSFATVMYRRHLIMSRPARALLLILWLWIGLQLAAGAWLLVRAFQLHEIAWYTAGLAVAVSYPLVVAHGAVVPLLLGRWLVVGPRQRQAIRRSAEIFARHPGIRVAIAGSYGKTSMKELLATVLGSGLVVAASPGNRNVPIAHAAFAASLQGDEDVLLVECGEAQPGDITRFVHQLQPTHGIITGLAPAHLDGYKSLAAAGRDIFSLALAVPKGQLYVNGDSSETKPFLDKHMQTYGHQGALGWNVSKVKVGVRGTSFVMSKAGDRSRQHHVHSPLLGRHQVGPLVFAAALAMELGVDDGTVMAAIARAAAFEHRMQPYQQHGAWIIDDTYNGNLEGVKAGTALLAELPAKRKWYVTPGLVEQGRESQANNRQVGELVAAAKPDIVVLMRNSAEPSIRSGLEAAGFKGDIRTEHDPLAFYTNLQHFVAAGDVVLMQNDWTDNYA